MRGCNTFSIRVPKQESIIMHEYTSCCTLTWLMRSKAPLLGKMAEFLESIDTVCCKQKNRDCFERIWSLQFYISIVNVVKQKKINDFVAETPLMSYWKCRFEGVSTLLSHSKRSTACQAAQLPPYSLPLQCVVGHTQRKLQKTQKCVTELEYWDSTYLEVPHKHSLLHLAQQKCLCLSPLKSSKETARLLYTCWGWDWNKGHFN